MHIGGKYKILWSNDAIYKSGYLVPLHESIKSQGAMADRVKRLPLCLLISVCKKSKLIKYAIKGHCQHCLNVRNGK